jgi:DNA-binding NarL/FixJ family response regulator
MSNWPDLNMIVSSAAWRLEAQGFRAPLKLEGTMTFENTRPSVILRDALPLRRAAFHSLLLNWAVENNIEIVATGDAISGKTHQREELSSAPRLQIIVLGGIRVEDPAVLGQISQHRRLWPEVPVAVISDIEDRGEVAAAFREGARGFIPTALEPNLVMQALGFILAGGTFFPPNVLDRPGRDGAEVQNRRPPAAHSLTPRQLDVLALLREGKSNKLIARDLAMCESTVKVHVRQIMRKLGAANRTQAALTGISVVEARTGDGSSRSAPDNADRSRESTGLSVVLPQQSRAR